MNAANPNVHRSAGSGPDDVVLVVVAVTAAGAHARAAEAVLGRRCAEGLVEVLDGILVERPDGDGEPTWRPLQNLPRLAALPDREWLRTVARLSGDEVADPPATLPVGGAALRAGASALVVIAQLVTPMVLDADLRAAGAAVTLTSLDFARYDRLRQ